MSEVKRPDLVPHHDSKSYLDAWLEQVKQKLGPERLASVKKFLAKAPSQFVCATPSVPDSSLLHWSLGLRHYTSFTSPIRKYVDLTVHRQVLGMLDRCSGTGGGSTHDEALTRTHSDSHGSTRLDSHVEHFVNIARLLDIHEANYTAFKKAVGNMFSILSGQTASFTVLVDTDRSKFSVAAEIDSLHVYRDLLLLSKAGLPDDRITAFGHPLKDIKMKMACDSKIYVSNELDPGEPGCRAGYCCHYSLVTPPSHDPLPIRNGSRSV
jgi:hypothetical protein